MDEQGVLLHLTSSTIRSLLQEAAKLMQMMAQAHAIDLVVEQSPPALLSIGGHLQNGIELLEPVELGLLFDRQHISQASA